MRRQKKEQEMKWKPLLILLMMKDRQIRNKGANCNKYMKEGRKGAREKLSYMAMTLYLPITHFISQSVSQSIGQ